MTPKELATWNIKQVKPHCKKMTTAETIVEAIVYDILDRRGLKQEFRQIDEDIVKEIKEVWRETIVQIALE